MDHITATFNRVRELRDLVMPQVQHGDFASLLDDALAGTPAAGEPPKDSRVDAATMRALSTAFLGSGPTVTLGTMMTTLGAPAAVPTAPAAPPMVMPVSAEAGSRFGVRIDPFTHESRMHKGIDFGAPMGAPIFAAMAGEVVFAGERGGFGNLVIVDHGGGLQTYYAHQSVIEAAVGDHVAGGARIGQIGSTGRSTGPHLHFEVRVDGAAVDPAPYLGLA
jgi:murein DD-endopeptidase MepM/ murein hydrolase activator NlpD